MTANPAKLFGIYPRKGTISPGSEADLVLVDPEARITAHSSRFLSRSGGSGKAYDGLEFSGRILTTLSRGRVVYDKGQVAEGPGGKLVSPDGPPRNVTETQASAT